MHIAAKFVALSLPPHRSHHPITHHESPQILALALLDEFLNQHVLLRALQGLHNGLRHLGGIRQNHTHALGPLQKLDDDRGSSHLLNRGQDILLPPHKGRVRHPDVMPTQDLHRVQFVPAARDPERRV